MKRIAAAFLLLVGCLLFASNSMATFPGKNGHILYAGKSGGIWSIPPTGGHPRILGHSMEAFTPAVSPDGHHVVFATFDPDVSSSVWEMNTDGSNLHSVSHVPNHSTCPSFLPSGRQIVFYSGYGIWAINRDGSHRRRLIVPAPSCPAVSPDGHIAFIKFVRFGPSHEGTEILVTNANGSHVRTVLRTRAHDFNLSFAPDGRTIVFTGDSPEKDIYAINTDGKHLRRLTHQPKLNECPTFSPDGRKIVYIHKTRRRPRRLQIWMMTATGSHQHRISSGEISEGSCPQWEAK
jgi:TolB protein